MIEYIWSPKQQNSYNKHNIDKAMQTPTWKYLARKQTSSLFKYIYHCKHSRTWWRKEKLLFHFMN